MKFIQFPIQLFLLLSPAWQTAIAGREAADIFVQSDQDLESRSVSDIQSLILRQDGKYDVVCKNGAHEIVTVEQIKNDLVCNTQAPPPDPNIVAVFSRPQGEFFVLCASYSWAIASAATIKSGQACVADTSDPLFETFSEPFIRWRSRFLATKSNLINYYVGVGGKDEAHRGNNPIGLWIHDGVKENPNVSIKFAHDFAARIKEFSLHICAHNVANLVIYDMGGAKLLDVSVPQGSCLAGLEGYTKYSVSSLRGVKGFDVLGSPKGNVGITHVKVSLKK